MAKGQYTLFEDSVVDTYGGDFTYLDVTYNINSDGSYTFYEHYYGCGWISDNPDAGGEVTDYEKIKDYTNQIPTYNFLKIQIAEMPDDERQNFFNELKTLYNF